MAILDTRGVLRRCAKCDTAVADDAQTCVICGEPLGASSTRDAGGKKSEPGPGLLDDAAPARPVFGSAGAGAIFTQLGLGAGTGMLTGQASGLATQFVHAFGEVAVRLMGFKMGEDALDDNPYRSSANPDVMLLVKRRIFSMLFPFRTRLREPQLIALYRDLAKYAESGIGFHDALARLQKGAKSPVLQRILTEIRNDILQGSTLAEAFGRHAYAFQPLDLALIEVGEALGTVADNMRLLVEIIEERRALRDQLAKKFVQPVMLIFLANYVITLPILMFSGFFSYLATIALPTFFIGGGVVFFTVIVPVVLSALGKDLNDRVRLDFPGIGSVARANALGRFSRALGAAIEAGVEIDRGLRMAARAADNTVVERAVIAALPFVRERGLADGLKRGGVLTEDTAAELAHGEATGTIAPTLRQISKDARARAARGTQILGSILAFTLILLSALYAVYSVFVKMFLAASAVRETLITPAPPTIKFGPFGR